MGNRDTHTDATFQMREKESGTKNKERKKQRKKQTKGQTDNEHEFKARCLREIYQEIQT